MKSFRISRNTSVLIIIIALIISLLTNVYTSVMNSRYKIIIGRETYENIEEIRRRNESSLTTLVQCIKAKSINNEELLSLYKNYSTISKEFNNLWLSYKAYGSEDIISINKKSKITDDVPTQVYSRIENLLYEYLNYEMRTNNDKFSLTGNRLQNFYELYNITNDLNNFYIDFNETNLSDIDVEDRELTYIKNVYWIDILKGINNIIEDHSDYEFIFKE
ncbi:MAG: hypothetical protein IJO26_03830 [Clostridium sp.]|nr:hypothetical protein [Clostridium sp.]